MHNESEYSAMEYSPEKCAELGYMAIEDANMMIISVKDGDTYAGLMIASVRAPEFSHDLIAWDTLIYVHPDYRGTRAAILLLKEYRRWSIARGAKMIFMRTTTGIEPQKTGKLFEKLGFRYVGGNYLLEV